MPITNTNLVRQALANLRLENMSVSDEVQDLLKRALNGENITTTDILNSIAASH